MSIVTLQRRMHEAGRIRMGDQVPTQNGGKRPRRGTNFRITSRNLEALQILAGQYGGIPREWADAPVGKQYELYTDTDTLDVIVIPESMGMSQHFELWSGGGCQRRCNGEEMTNGSPCVCMQMNEAGVPDDRQNPRCRPTTRVNVMLAAVPTSGTWRFESHGFYAAEELPGSYEMARLLANQTGRKLLSAKLVLEEREIKRPGEPTKNFVVPCLDIEHMTLAALTSGTAEQLAISAPPGAVAALPAASPVTPVETAPPPSLREQMAAVGGGETDEGPKRANAAEPIKDTGVDFGGAGQPPAPAKATAAKKAPAKAQGAAKKAQPAKAAAPAQQAPPRAAEPAQAPEPAAATTEEQAPQEAPGQGFGGRTIHPQGSEPLTPDQRTRLLATLSEMSVIQTREDRLSWISDTIGRPVTSTNDLSKIEAGKCIEAADLELGRTPPPRDEPGGPALTEHGYEPFPDDDEPAHALRPEFGGPVPDGAEGPWADEDGVDL